MTSSEKDLRTRDRVLGLLVAKGYLHAPGVRPLPNVKVFVRGAIHVGETFEPRVLEVLPAALVHFPRHFLGRRDIDPELAEICKALNAGRETGPDFRWVKYRDAHRWANLKLKDRRTRPLRERKSNKTLRLHPEVTRKLAGLAAKAKTTETAIVEQLIRAA